MAISENDIDKCRNILLKEFLTTDYPKEVYEDAINLAETYGVFEEHNNEELVDEKRRWTENYLSWVKDQLNVNFSKERFILVVKMTRDFERTSGHGNLPIEVSNKYTNFKKIAFVSAIVASISVVAVSAYYLKKVSSNK